MGRFLRIDLAICLFTAALCVWALARHPYSYYELLRLITCGVSAYMAWRCFASEMTALGTAFGVLAVLFNPLLPIHLSRETWAPIDLIGAAILAYGAFQAPRFKKVHA